MPQDTEEVVAEVSAQERVSGLENVRASARELANRVRDTGLSVGEFAAEELSFALNLAEDLQGQLISAELLKEVRSYPTVYSFRKSTHRAVDLGFDAIAIGVKIGNDLTDGVLAPRDRQQATVQA